MSMSDPIADLLTRIRNANAANHDSLELDHSRLKLEIVKVLQQEGYVKSYEVTGEETHRPVIKIHLKYGPRREKVLTDLKRVSKPGRRVYTGCGSLPKVMGGLGIAILTTPNGVMTDRQARRQGVGGEVLCYVW
jgi:small subunit ribosomal protein S8